MIPIFKRSAAGLLVIFLAVAGLMGLGQTAKAAIPVTTYPNAISNIVIELKDTHDGPARVGEQVRLSADWAVPDGAVEGETFAMGMPPELIRVTGGFNLENAAGDIVGQCTITTDTPPVLLCALSSFVNGKEDVGGQLWFFAQADKETTATELAFEVGAVFVQVPLPGEGGIVGAAPAPTTLTKDGWSAPVDNRIGWTIRIPSSMAQDGRFTVTDVLLAGADQENHSYVGDSLRVAWRAVDAGGNWSGDWVSVPADSVVGSTFADGGKTFSLDIIGVPADQSRVYQITYYSQGDGMVFVGDQFANNVTVNSTSQQGNFTYVATGGGTGDGSEYARFTIAKEVTGEASALVPADTQFTVAYAVGTENRTMEFGVGEAARVKSERYPIGSTFIIEEINLPVIAGVTWGDYVISGSGVTANGDGTYSLTPGSSDPVVLGLNNPATVTPPTLGNLSVTKSVTGDGAALLPAGIDYPVAYSYTLAGAEPTTGELSLRAGESMKLPADVPVGTVVTLTEAKPANVVIDPSQTVVYGDPIFTAGAVTGPTATVTVTDSTQIVEVALENPTTVMRTVGNLSVTKSVTGDGAALLPAGVTYPVAYSYTLEGAAPTTGELLLEAGASLALPADVPVGTVVTLTEAKPADVVIDPTQTVVYGEPIFTSGAASGASLAVTVTTAGQLVEVTLENPTTVTEVPPTTAPPTTVPPTTVPPTTVPPTTVPPTTVPPTTVPPTTAPPTTVPPTTAPPTTVPPTTVPPTTVPPTTVPPTTMPPTTMPPTTMATKAPPVCVTTPPATPTTPATTPPVMPTTPAATSPVTTPAPTTPPICATTPPATTPPVCVTPSATTPGAPTTPATSPSATTPGSATTPVTTPSATIPECQATTPPATTAPTVTTPAPVTPVDRPLANTGAHSGAVVAFALALAGVGFLTLMLKGRRRKY